MNTNSTNGNLRPIFLFSLPRSGSTLCQRIIGSHPDVATVNEPHFLIPMIYSMNDMEVRSTYNHYYSAQAIQDFCNYLPNGEKDYLSELHEFALNLYSKAADHKVKYFLDKTPKYHLIADDIIRLFPEAKIIYLWRNPLSIISSMIETWGGGNWNVFHFKIDLYQGLENLIKSYKKYEGQVYSFQYEDVLLDPVDTWRKLFGYLELAFDPSVLTRFSKVQFTGRVKDPNSSMPEFQSVNPTPLYKWKAVLNTPLRVAWSRKYLRWIGEERLSIMGYDMRTLLADLNSLPVSLHHFPQDLYRMPMGEAYHVMELQLIKQKYLSWRSGQRIYMHN